ncbi:MAG: hypothetical protein IMF16_06065, partial [Proteobacteria bacterium]|nr:hypothetical protein [Pseudomonadota bacterium]
LHFHRLGEGRPADYQYLSARIAAIEKEYRLPGNRVLDLAIPPGAVPSTVAGANKAPAFARALAPNANPKSSPAAAIKLIDGQLVWWVDDAAAG